MEHRLGARRAVRAAVVLHPPGAQPVTGLTREVSISGMFVEVPPQAFSGNAVVDVELTLPGGAELRTYRWQAMVIRQARDGVGLMFDRLRPPAIGRLLANLDAGLPVSRTALGADTVSALHKGEAGQLRP